MQFLGLAHTPRKIADLLSAAAGSAASAAAELSALGRGQGDPVVVAQAAEDAQRLAHEVVLEAGEMLGGGLDRSDVLAIALSLNAAGDRLDAAAAALQRAAPDAVPWEALTGVVRDCARELARAIDRLDGPTRERDAHLERIEALHDEGLRLLRRARAQLFEPGADALVAMVGEEALRRLERALRALRRVARAVRQVVVKHA